MIGNTHTCTRTSACLIFDAATSCSYIYRFTECFAGVSAARQVYREAITSLPNIAMLRIAYAEFEEQYGSSGLVPVILKSAYEAIPSLLTFSAWQRCIRRKEGKIPARKCFSDTFPLRNNLTFGPEV